jgi:hypothetical protein
LMSRGCYVLESMLLIGCQVTNLHSFR